MPHRAIANTIVFLDFRSRVDILVAQEIAQQRKSSVKRGRAMENTESEWSHRAAKMGSAVIRLRSTLPRRAMFSESQDNRNFSSFLEVAGLRACR
jgi:hypothetical protein